MCIYVRTVPLCGHAPPTLLSYASCPAVLAQLMRITEPEAWSSPDALLTMPFDLPDDCDPRPENIWDLYSDDYCGWECRNNAYLVRTALVVGPDLPLGEVGLMVDANGEVEVTGGMLPAYKPGNERGQCVLVGRDNDGEEGGFYGVGGGASREEPMVLGMPDARYGPGSERLGIGWRSD